jgi:hypothetical protein
MMVSVYVIHVSVVGEVATFPAATFVSNIAVAEAVIDAAIEVHLRAPISLVEKERSVQGFHGGAGGVCALRLTFLSAPNDRSSGHNETINQARGRDIFLSCDTRAATNASTPGFSPTPKLCPPEKVCSLNLADIENLYCPASVRLSGFRLYKSTNGIGKTLPCFSILI